MTNKKPALILFFEKVRRWVYRYTVWKRQLRSLRGVVQFEFCILDGCYLHKNTDCMTFEFV